MIATAHDSTDFDGCCSYDSCTCDSTATTRFGAGLIICPREFFVVEFEPHEPYEDALIAMLRQKAKKYAAQWILRIGMRLRFDPPDLMPVTWAVRYLKILRCNRFGIGLRIKKDK